MLIIKSVCDKRVSGICQGCRTGYIKECDAKYLGREAVHKTTSETETGCSAVVFLYICLVYMKVHYFAVFTYLYGYGLASTG